MPSICGWREIEVCETRCSFIFGMCPERARANHIGNPHCAHHRVLRSLEPSPFPRSRRSTASRARRTAGTGYFPIAFVTLSLTNSNVDARLC